MLDYSTIFFVECQEGNGFLFRFVNFAQIRAIFYSRTTNKNTPFICAFYVSLFSNDMIAEKAVLPVVLPFGQCAYRFHTI